MSAKGDREIRRRRARRRIGDRLNQERQGGGGGGGRESKGPTEINYFQLSQNNKKYYIYLF